ncbi:unnamed protein product [Phytomonas sp. EM1]|nr:unnamed protein product [Phytomonas sp. EM1]|eukprot:CCW60754.1 unnamed protein product [Phytomonas sp. isolate EM1]
MQVFRGVLGILLCTLLFHVIQVASISQVTFVSDVHYDPFYGQKNAFSHCTSAANAALGEPGCDSPKALMDSMASDISLQKSDFTLYAGDWQRHKFDAKLVADVLFVDMNKSFSSILTLNLPPVKSFSGAWGNNDVVPDYYFDVTKKDHVHLKERIKILNGSLYSKEEADTMVQCAFFSRRLEEVSFVNLHSLIWSTTLKPPLADNVDDPCGQFAFLEKELEFARKKSKKVVIIAHIPPILDTYIVIRNGKFSNASHDMLWNESFYKRYINLMSAFQDVVSAQLFGHLHLFYLLCFPGIGSPAFVLPSISPIYGNVPSYLLSTFSNSWDLIDLNQRSLIDSGWRDTVNVKGALGLVDGFGNLNSTREQIKGLYKNEVMWLNHLKLHNGGQATDQVFYHMNTSSFSRAVIVCSMLSGIYDDIKKCVDELVASKEPVINDYPKLITFLTIFLPIIGVIIVACLIALIVCIVVRGRKIKNFKELDSHTLTVHVPSGEMQQEGESCKNPNKELKVQRDTNTNQGQRDEKVASLKKNSDKQRLDGHTVQVLVVEPSNQIAKDARE